MRRLLAVAVLIPLTLGGVYFMRGAEPATNDPREEQQIAAKLDRLTSILRKLGPIASVSRSLIGTAPDFMGVSYCWQFKELDSDLYTRVEETLKKFRGAIAWNFNFQFNDNGACITGLSADNRFYSPVGNAGLLIDAFAGPAQVMIASEVEKLCDFMDNAFGVDRADGDAPTRDPFPSDWLNESAVFDVTLVRDVKKFTWPAPTSVADRHLDFGLTYDEWYALYFEVLGKSADRTEGRAMGFDQGVEGFPFLSRLNDIHESVGIGASEVEAIEMECFLVQERARGNLVAARALKKLIFIFECAREFDTGVWFSGQ